MPANTAGLALSLRTRIKVPKVFNPGGLFAGGSVAGLGKARTW